METCPICRASLNGATTCRRCRADLATAQAVERRGRALAGAAMLALVQRDGGGAEYWLGRARLVHATPTVRALETLLDRAACWAEHEAEQEKQPQFENDLEHPTQATPAAPPDAAPQRLTRADGNVALAARDDAGRLPPAGALPASAAAIRWPAASHYAAGVLPDDAAYGGSNLPAFAVTAGSKP